MTVNGVEHWQCKRCKRYLPREEMGQRKSRWNGLNCYCLECLSARAKEAWYKDPARARAMSRRQSKEWADKNREYCRDYQKARYAAGLSKRERTPKFIANEAVTQAVYKGRLHKPDRCEDCGEAVDKPLLHGHHEDYSKKLDVIWLCPLCHGKRHRIDQPD